jgi:hypothetical protein
MPSLPQDQLSTHWVLRPRSHDLDELEFYALSYFDNDRWSLLQNDAFDRLSRQLQSPLLQMDSRTVLNHRPTTPISFLIQLIGEIFFLDGLRDVQFQWVYLEQDEQAGLSTKTADGKSEVMVNTGHWAFRKAAEGTRWKVFRDVLAHEATHCYLRRYAKEGTILDSHNETWVRIAYAVEKRLKLAFDDPSVHLGIDISAPDTFKRLFPATIPHIQQELQNLKL